jgi:hypothetical protein
MSNCRKLLISLKQTKNSGISAFSGDAVYLHSHEKITHFIAYPLNNSFLQAEQQVSS